MLEGSDRKLVERVEPNFLKLDWPGDGALQDLRTYGRRLCLPLNGDLVGAQSFSSYLTPTQCQVRENRPKINILTFMKIVGIAACFGLAD